MVCRASRASPPPRRPDAQNGIASKFSHFPFPLTSWLAGECKQAMVSYLACIKKVKGVNEGQCRELAKAYLSCRMDRDLMARDEFKNLGFHDDAQGKKPTSSPGAAANS